MRTRLRVWIVCCHWWWDADGRAIAVIVIFCTVTSATYWKNGRAYSAFLAYCVAILGSILVNTLPSSNRVGLLFSYWISGESPCEDTPAANAD